MRERFLDAFDVIRIANLHGDRIISEYAPDGRTSETIFAMHGHSPGIKIGTAVALLTRRARIVGGSSVGRVMYRDFHCARAVERRAELVESLSDPDLDHDHQGLSTTYEFGLPFKPIASEAGYLTWLKLPELFPTSFPGVKTSRDEFLVDIDRERLEARLRLYFDPAVSHEEMRRIAPSVMEPAAHFAPVEVRTKLLERGLRSENIIRYHYRPFDTRWLFWESDFGLLDRARPEYRPHVFNGNMD